MNIFIHTLVFLSKYVERELLGKGKLKIYDQTVPLAVNQIASLTFSTTQLVINEVLANLIILQ